MRSFLILVLLSALLAAVAITVAARNSSSASRNRLQRADVASSSPSPATSVLSSLSPSSASLPLSARLRASLPNVVLIMADDQGWGDVGFNFPNSRDTPFLDSLALRSFVGLDHHSGASVCSPSRAALLTGRMAPRTGVWRNFDTVAVGGLPTNETILAEYFKQKKYATAIHGKWSSTHRAYTSSSIACTSDVRL